MRIILLGISLYFLMACHSNSSDDPEEFLPELIPSGQLAHGGVLSPDGDRFYITLSDSLFQGFDIMVTTRKNGQWEPLESAQFNSEYDEHGLSFSTDSKTLYFSSTRPTGIDGTPETWHLWKCTRITNGWSEPELVTLPNMSDRLISHPSFTESGRMYFHAGQPDYSDLFLYYSDLVNGRFSEPKKVSFASGFDGVAITPFVAKDESFLLFGGIQEGVEKLYYSQQKNGSWQNPIALNDKVNFNNRANPFVSWDSRYLYFATGKMSDTGKPFEWMIKRIEWQEAIPDHIIFDKN